MLTDEVLGPQTPTGGVSNDTADAVGENRMPVVIYKLHITHGASMIQSIQNTAEPFTKLKVH